MKVNPYLLFDGQCEQAFKFYEDVLGGKIEAMIRFDEMQESGDYPPESAKKIMHVSLRFGDNVLMGSDDPSPNFQKAQGMSVALHTETPADAEGIFAALSRDATTMIMPIGETSWALRFGMFVDRFGTPWMINCSKPM
ncbi:VOC family protein [Phyllobacterium lublinensis]|uniref:VOC family protein n=1 Tax=Phyllobacterium lublinensis TaxID=2875708 RepID=UPI001CCA4FFD|nr:VOC family protein [Phyllobacterium sp. 2063]MBZ9655634.1 VOC family protein [Phyllobacterium sp. 2063]